MRIRLAALLCLLLAVTFTLTGCGGSSGSGNNGSPATFLFTQAAPDFNSAIVNSYPAASTGSAVAATSSAALPTDTIGYGVHGDGAGKIYSLGNSTDGTVNGNLTGTLVVNVYSTTNGVLTLTRSFNYTPADGALAFSLAADPTGIVYISLTDSTFLKFAANASGAATPTIFNTGVILFPMATDSAGNLYGYAGSGVIGVFPPYFTNPIPPKVPLLQQRCYRLGYGRRLQSKYLPHRLRLNRHAFHQRILLRRQHHLADEDHQRNIHPHGQSRSPRPRWLRQHLRGRRPHNGDHIALQHHLYLLALRLQQPGTHQPLHYGRHHARPRHLRRPCSDINAAY